jgi:hypothetical protein
MLGLTNSSRIYLENVKHVFMYVVSVGFMKHISYRVKLFLLANFTRNSISCIGSETA